MLSLIRRRCAPCTIAGGDRQTPMPTSATASRSGVDLAGLGRTEWSAIVQATHRVIDVERRGGYDLASSGADGGAQDRASSRPRRIYIRPPRGRPVPRTTPPRWCRSIRWSANFACLCGLLRPGLGYEGAGGAARARCSKCARGGAVHPEHGQIVGRWSESMLGRPTTSTVASARTISAGLKLSSISGLAAVPFSPAVHGKPPTLGRGRRRRRVGACAMKRRPDPPDSLAIASVGHPPETGGICGAIVLPFGTAPNRRRQTPPCASFLRTTRKLRRCRGP